VAVTAETAMATAAATSSQRRERSFMGSSFLLPAGAGIGVLD
jgi:hypothetical protein